MSVLDDLAVSALTREIEGQIAGPMLEAYICAASKLLAEKVSRTRAIEVHATRIRRLHEDQSRLGVQRGRGGR